MKTTTRPYTTAHPRTLACSASEGNRHRAIKKPFATTKPRLERLEDRLALSGFTSDDGSYFEESWIGGYGDVIIQPADQKIVAAGGMGAALAVSRYDAAGSADSTYGTAGVATLAPPNVSVSAASVVLQTDGKAVVSGAFSESTDGKFGVARFTASGTLDTSFNRIGWNSTSAVPNNAYESAYSVGLQSSGKIVVGGMALPTAPHDNTPYDRAFAARFTISGVLDSGNGGFGDLTTTKPKVPSGAAVAQFGPGNNIFYSTAVQGDDKVVAVGIAQVPGSASKMIIARYTKDGSLDTKFNGSGYSIVLPTGFSLTAARGVAIQPDGRIVVVGNYSVPGDPDHAFVARFNTNGNLDTTFGGGLGYTRLHVANSTPVGGFSHLVDVAIQPDGKIVATGKASADSTNIQHLGIFVARLNANGTPDQDFGQGGTKLASPPAGPDYHSFTPSGVALQSDGSIIVSGSDNWDPNNLAGSSHPLLMRFSGSAAAAAEASSAATDAALLFFLTEDLTPGGGRRK